MQMKVPKLSYANVVASLALFIALGGTSWALARNSVGARELKRSAVTSVKVKDRSLTSSDLAASAQGRRGPRGAQGPAGASGVAPSSEAWRSLPLGAGWVAYGQGHRDPTFRKDQLGNVHVRGLITRPAGQTAANEPLAYLPPGYRPSQHDLFSVTDGGHGHLRVDVFPDGSVVIVGGGGPTVSLNAITFATD